MTRARAAVGLTLAAVVALVTAPGGSAAPAVAPPVHVARAFTARAEAYPMESAPGSRNTTVAVRQASTKATSSNPPVDAFARATAADLGLAEAYLGQQGPSADADTATAGDDDDVVVEESGSRMEVHVDPSPSSWASATGNASGSADQGTSGTIASRSTSDGSGNRLVATAASEVNDLTIGLLFLGSGRFDGRAEIDGTPAGARAEGLIRTSDATFAGVPIILGADGVRIDQSRIPDPLLQSSTATIQEWFGQGGYADIRVVQPKVEIAKDGSSARVSGGGVLLYFTNNDPAERYSLSYALLGGSAEAGLAGVLAQPTPDRDPPPTRPTIAKDVTFRPITAPPVAVAPDAIATVAVPSPVLTRHRGSQGVSLAVPWAGWVFALVLVAAGWATAGALRLPALAGPRRRLDRFVNDLADRYLRG